MDIIDRVAEYEEMERLAAIDKALQQTGNVMGMENCIDCADPIPAARRQANPNANRCLECQQYHEKNRHATPNPATKRT